MNKEFWVVKITLKSTPLCERAFVCDTATQRACVTVAERPRTLRHRRWISLVKLRLCEYLSEPSVYSSRKGADVRRCLHVRGVYCNHVNEAQFAPPVLTQESPAWTLVRMSARVSSFSFRKPSSGWSILYVYFPSRHDHRLKLALSLAARWDCGLKQQLLYKCQLNMCICTIVQTHIWSDLPSKTIIWFSYINS